MALTEHDRNLLKRCLDNEPGAWKDFVDRFMGLFVHVIQHTAHSRSVRLSRDDVDDLCADVFVGLVANDFGALRRFRAKSSLATYLTVIARRIVVRQIAERRMAEALGHVAAHGKSIERADAVVTTTPPEQPVEDREEVERLLRVLDDRDADAVRMHYLEGRSYSEIAQELNISENSVGSILSRAKRALSAKRQVQS